MSNKTYIPPEVLQLMQLGREGKLWRVVIIYNVAGEHETKMQVKKNLTDSQLKETREDMFKLGFVVPIEPGHWKIICPMDIVSVDLFRQEGYQAEG